MKWFDKLAMLALGVLLVLGREVDATAVMALLGAVTAACLLGYFAKRAATLAACAVWAALCLAFPAFNLFWPVLLYEAFLNRLWPLAAALPVCLLAGWGAFTWLEVGLMAFGAAAAALLAVHQTAGRRLQRENREIRDDFTGLNLALEQKNTELMEARDAQVRLATLSERGRIAREIHDNVGHMLARSMMQVGAVMALNKDETVAESLDALKDTLTLAMNSVRESVHDLRDEALDLHEMVRAMVRDFPGYEYNLNYDMGDVPARVVYSFAAVIREGLSNVARHSNATRVTIDLQEHPAFYRLSFADNGTLPAAGPGAAGMGLDNMRERTEALGGRFSVNTEGGFGIHITVPRQAQPKEARE